MKNLKEQKPDAEIVQAVDVELNEEQLEEVSGGTNWPNIADIIDKIRNPPIPD